MATPGAAASAKPGVLTKRREKKDTRVDELDAQRARNEALRQHRLDDIKRRHDHCVRCSAIVVEAARERIRAATYTCEEDLIENPADAAEAKKQKHKQRDGGGGGGGSGGGGGDDDEDDDVAEGGRRSRRKKAKSFTPLQFLAAAKVRMFGGVKGLAAAKKSGKKGKDGTAASGGAGSGDKDWSNWRLHTRPGVYVLGGAGNKKGNGVLDFNEPVAVAACHHWDLARRLRTKGLWVGNINDTQDIASVIAVADTSNNRVKLLSTRIKPNSEVQNDAKLVEKLAGFDPPVDESAPGYFEGEVRVLGLLSETPAGRGGTGAVGNGGQEPAAAAGGGGGAAGAGEMSSSREGGGDGMGGGGGGSGEDEEVAPEGEKLSEADLLLRQIAERAAAQQRKEAASVLRDTKGYTRGRFLAPLGVAVDPKGLVYVTDNNNSAFGSPRVQIFDQDGHLVRYFDNTIQPRKQHLVYGDQVPATVNESKHVFLDVNGKPLLPDPGDYVTVRAVIDVTLRDLVVHDSHRGHYIDDWANVCLRISRSLVNTSRPNWYVVLRLLENCRVGRLNWRQLLKELRLPQQEQPDWYTRISDMFDAPDTHESFGHTHLRKPKMRHICEAAGKGEDETVGKVEVEGTAVNLVTGWGLDERLKAFGTATGDDARESQKKVAVSRMKSTRRFEAEVERDDQSAMAISAAAQQEHEEQELYGGHRYDDDEKDGYDGLVEEETKQQQQQQQQQGTSGGGSSSRPDRTKSYVAKDNQRRREHFAMDADTEDDDVRYAFIYEAGADDKHHKHTVIKRSRNQLKPAAMQVRGV